MPHGWSSQQRLGQPADIQALMYVGGIPSSSYNALPHDTHKLEISSNNQEYGSATSVEISHEMFAPSAPQSVGNSPGGSKGSSPLGPSPQASNAHFRSLGENPKAEVMPEQKPRWMQQPLPPQHSGRSLSAKPSKKHTHHLGQHMPELSTSMGYVGVDHKRSNHNPHSYNEDPMDEKASVEMSYALSINTRGLPIYVKNIFSHT